MKKGNRHYEKNKKISKFCRYSINIPIPELGVKKGAIFEWDDMDNCFVTKSVPWFISPLISRSQIRRKMFDLVDQRKIK